MTLFAYFIFGLACYRWLALSVKCSRLTGEVNQLKRQLQRRRQQDWQRDYTPDGYQRRVENNALWLLLSRDARGVNYSYREDARSN